MVLRVAYSYDEAGRVTQVQYPGESELIAYIDNGTPGTGWDRNGRLKHLRYELDGSPLRSFAYDYDESGNRTQATEVAGSTTTVYKYYYDWLDRLLRVEKGPNTSSLSPVSIYTYDESDNPTKLELPEAFLEYDFTFDLASNIETRKETDTTVSSAPVVKFTENFTPDEDGNVLTRTRTVGADTHQITYEWDDFNKLVAVSASLNGSPAAEPKQSNAYAANGFRRQKTKKDGEIVTEYAEGLATAVAKAQAETITYIHGHQILGFEQGGQFYYFLTDALGSVRDIVDGNGQVVQQYQYDERGNHVIAPMSGGPASPKTFVGGLSVNDDTADGGLYLMGHRFYDPSLGRFLNRDPIGFAGGLNLFSYGANNPVTMTDHTGLDPLAQEVYGINSEEQAEVYAAGGIFLVAVGTVLTLGVPDPSDLGTTAAIAAIVKSTRKLKQVGKAGARYWRLGKADCRGEEEVAEYFAGRGAEVFLASDPKLVKAMPDLRINGTWWEVKTPNAPDLYNAVRSSLLNTSRQHKNHGNRSRLILNLMDRDVTVNQVVKELNRVVKGRDSTKRVHDIMIMTKNRDPIIVQTWRLGR